MSQRAATLIGVILTLAAAVVWGAAAPARVQRVTGSVERVIHPQGPCRGGAAIQREEIEELEARVQRLALRNATFTVFAGSKHVGKPVTRFKTDRAARFEVDLPVGTFCVMAGEHEEAAPAKVASRVPANPHLDADCLRELAVACDATLRVRADSTRAVKVTLETFTRCPQPWAQPCYHGPMPP